MIRIIQGDCRDVLKTLPDASVQCCVTSPPYFGLRDYGVAGQIGLEPSPDEYIAELVAVFREVRRVLRTDGTCWLNLGDSILNKHLQMIPPRVAIALQADGWWLRSSIIWVKPNTMPEPTKDRPTSAYEYVFLLTKSARYFYDSAAVAESASESTLQRAAMGYSHGGTKVNPDRQDNGRAKERVFETTRNIRNVWTIAPQPYSEAHFATFPPELAERCIKAGSREGDTILDPFSGAGTTCLVASRLNRRSIGIELNAKYAVMSERRIYDDCPMFSGMESVR